MLPSNNNINGNSTNPILLYHKPYINDQLFSNFYNFPSSPPPYNHLFDTNLINDEEELFLQQYLDLPLMSPTIEDKEPDTTKVIINNTMVDNSNKKSTTTTTMNISPQKKRASKKDRHSKITTAQGPRDRRMRLSLEIAREFFGLQDMLGYDKASKTVEWLLSKAKLDIKKLVGESKNDGEGDDLNQMVDSSSVVAASSISECEVISGIKKPSSSKCVRKEKIIRATKELRKPVFLARETREKARARARERTKMKINMCAKSKQMTTNINNGDPMSLEVVDDHSLVPMDKWSPISSIFDYQQGDATEISHQLQFEDFHFDRKTWESYNFQSML